MNDERVNRLKQFAKQDAEPNEGEEDDFGMFGWLHGIRDKALMLELRLKTGNCVALGYAWLEKAEYNPSTGIILHFAGQKVTLHGAKLNQPFRDSVRLFEGLLRHRVTWLRETDRKDSTLADATQLVIESIKIE
jgi:hypothetical protein